MRLILGRAGTGKNQAVLELLSRCAKLGGPALLLVPEQSSFSYEKKLYFLLGAEESRHVEVMSFTKLAGELIQRSGGGARLRADDAVRVALTRRAVMQASDAVVYYRRSRGDFAFFSLVFSLIDELKNGGVTPERLAALSEFAPAGLSRTKFREMAEIYANYELLLKQRYDDPAGQIEAAAASVAAGRFFDGKTVVADGFTGFTEPEYALLGRIIGGAKEFTAALVLDEIGSGAPVFDPVRATARRLLEIGEREGRSCRTERLTGKRSMKSGGIAVLDAFLSGETAKKDTAGVFCIAGSDPYDEIERVAAEITSLVRDGGFRFSEIAVITRDLERYRSVVKRTFRSFDIPYFADWTENERFSPTASFVFAALALLDECSPENLLALLKTRLTDLPEREIASLEQYIFVWNVDRKRLLLPFRNHPEGIEGRLTAEAQTALAEAERARSTAMDWAGGLIARANRKPAKDVVKEIFFLMERCGAAKRLTERGAADAAFSMLDRLYQVLGDDRLAPEEISEISKVFFSGVFTGEIPESLEHVQVGSAERIRTDGPRAVFVVGLTEGSFPRAEFEVPLFTFSERDFINQNRGALARSFDGLLMMEELHLYNALTSASERVYLSFPAAGIDGESLSPSAKIKEYTEVFAPPPPESGNNRFYKVVNERTARRAYLEGGALGEEIGRSGVFDFTRVLDAAREEPVYRLRDPELLRRVAPKRMALSPSQTESFGQCRFRYFLEYAAHIRPLREAAISPLQAGNFIHAVLERVFAVVGGDLRTSSLLELFLHSDSAADEYITEKLREAAEISARTRYLADRLKRQARRLIGFLRAEQEQSEFRPADFELSIGGEGGVPPKILCLPDGTEIGVFGKVDRVDLADIGGNRYVRVVDYKTGTRKFSLDDVARGLNLQMLIYLFTLTENGAARYGALIPAGVLYMPADPIPPRFGGEKNPVEAYRMDGLLLDDASVVAAMERDAAGVFIPVKKKKDGEFDTASRRKLAGLETMGKISRHVDRIILEMVQSLKDGDIAAGPVTAKSASPCDYCPYPAVCRRDRITAEQNIAPGSGDIFLEGDGDA